MTEHIAPTSRAEDLLVEEAHLSVEPAPQFIHRRSPEFIWANVALFAAGCSTFALLYCVQPIMPLFSSEFSLSPAQASLSLSVTTQSIAVSILVARSLSEVVGRKRVMAASILASSVLLLASAFAPNWSAFLVCRFLAGIALSGLPATAMAYIGEEMHPDVAPFVMGLYIGGTGLGALFGRLLVSLIADVSSWRAGLFILGLLSLASGAVFFLKLPRSRHFKPHPLNAAALLASARSHIKDPVLVAIFALGFLLLGAYMAFFNYLGYRLVEAPYNFSQSAIGMIFFITLVGSGTAGITSHLAARLGRPISFCLLVLIMLAGALVSLASSLGVIIAGTTLLTFAFYGGHSVASGWVSIRARTAKSQAASFYLFTYYTGSSLLGYFGGFAWQHGRWPGITLLISITLGIALVISLALVFTQRRHSPRAELRL